MLLEHKSERKTNHKKNIIRPSLSDNNKICRIYVHYYMEMEKVMSLIMRLLDTNSNKRNTVTVQYYIQLATGSEFEPRHDKLNNVAVRPAKTQISLGVRPV